MAKTCFYCGRELAPGQRCSCRGTSSSAGGTAVTSGSSGSSASASPDPATHSSTAGTYDAGSASGYSSDSTHSSAAPDYSSCSADPSHYSKKASKKTKQVWNHAGSASSGAGTSDGKFSFARFIDQVRTKFPSISKMMRPVMNYIWHPVSTIQNRPQKVSVPKVLIINSIFATFTSLMVFSFPRDADLASFRQDGPLLRSSVHRFRHYLRDPVVQRSSSGDVLLRNIPVRQQETLVPPGAGHRYNVIHLSLLC